MDDRKRVSPDMWLEYRTRHIFQGLHCLCPLLWTTDQEPPYTEAKVLLKDSGDHIGEYVADCPNGYCKYLGQLPVAFQVKESLTRRKKKFLWNRSIPCMAFQGKLMLQEVGFSQKGK